MNSIVHHVTREETSVIRCLQDHFKLSEARARELLELGAVYHDKRRVESDIPLAKAAYMRIHLAPRRFAVAEIDWKAAVVAEKKDYLIVRKPTGIPSCSMVDNWLEHTIAQLEKVRGESLYVTQRLDVPVMGLMVIARNKKFQAIFNNLLLKRKVEKKYLAYTEVAPSVGVLTHYMEQGERTPRKLSLEEKQGWQFCQLEVEKVEPVSIGPHALFRSEIRLMTGRTHQIRAQLAFSKCPIFGDKRYGSSVRLAEQSREAIGLLSHRVQWLGEGPYILNPSEIEAEWQLTRKTV